MHYPELLTLYRLPFFDLIQRARKVYEEHWPKNEMQLCTLLSVKTGGCSEDCSYCAQSSRHHSGVEAERLMECEDIMERARAAKEDGATRFCMGAAWRGVRSDTKRFEQLLDVIRNVSELGIEVCVSLGELGKDEAKALKEAGLTAYNHNLDTSPDYYPNIVTTHTYEDRLRTIRKVQNAGLSLCCGGILGMGETIDDRLKMLEIISEFNPRPESVPINSLMPMPGTPFEGNQAIDVFELVRMIALARLAVPESKVRLSAGRANLSEEAQALCFFAGANSIFYGEKLLTAENPTVEADQKLLKKLGSTPQKPNAVPSSQLPKAIASETLTE